MKNYIETFLFIILFVVLLLFESSNKNDTTIIYEAGKCIAYIINEFQRGLNTIWYE